MKVTTLILLSFIGMIPWLQGCSNPEAEREAKKQQILDKYNEEVRAEREKRRKALGMPPFEEKR